MVPNASLNRAEGIVEDRGAKPPLLMEVKAPLPPHLSLNILGVNSGPSQRGPKRGQRPLPHQPQVTPMLPRLTADFWVHAYLTRLRLHDIPAFVVSKGDATAGAVMIKQSPLNGSATLFQRQFDMMADRREWVQIASGPEPDIDAQIARERSRDPDLWVIEVEDRQGRTLLDEPGLDG